MCLHPLDFRIFLPVYQFTIFTFRSWASPHQAPCRPSLLHSHVHSACKAQPCAIISADRPSMLPDNAAGMQLQRTTHAIAQASSPAGARPPSTERAEAHRVGACRHSQLQLVTPDSATRYCRAGVHVQHAGRAAPKPWQCGGNGTVGWYIAEWPACSGWRPDRPDHRWEPSVWTRQQSATLALIPGAAQYPLHILLPTCEYE